MLDHTPMNLHGLKALAGELLSANFVLRILAGFLLHKAMKVSMALFLIALLTQLSAALRRIFFDRINGSYMIL